MAHHMYLEASLLVLCFLFVIVLDSKNSQQTSCLDLTCPLSHPPLIPPPLPHMHRCTEAGIRYWEALKDMPGKPHANLVSAYCLSLIIWVWTKLRGQDSSYHYHIVKLSEVSLYLGLYCYFFFLNNFFKTGLRWMIFRVSSHFKTCGFFVVMSLLWLCYILSG